MSQPSTKPAQNGLSSNDYIRAVTALISSAHSWLKIEHQARQAKDANTAIVAADQARQDAETANRMRVAGGFKPLNVDELLASWK